MAHVSSRLARHGRAALVLTCALATRRALADTPPPQVDALATSIDRAAVVREALARNPALKAASHRVRAMRAMSHAEGKLPDPEVMFQVWQVPFARPYAFGDSQMVMAGVSQTFPAPGSSAARAEARGHSATAEEAMLADRARDLVRDVQHAYVELTEATARHAAHVEHRGVASRLLAAAEARQAAGGALDDVAQAELALARLDADIATEAASIARARARLNGLLARRFDAPLGDPHRTEPETSALAEDALAELAARSRPDLRAARARVDAESAALTAAEREATLPSFTVGASYFAPTTAMPFHGYGVSGAMSLPWIWGGNARKEEAQRSASSASREDVEDARLRVGVDVATAKATTHAAEERLRVLRAAALPAAKRALDVTFATYGTGRGDLFAVLRAEQAVVDTDIDIVAARATLDHALADLDWAAGTLLPRRPLASPPSLERSAP